MSRHWEVVIYAGLTVFVGLWLALRVVFLWMAEQKRWRAVPPYYGSPHSVSGAKSRLNVRRA